MRLKEILLDLDRFEMGQTIFVWGHNPKELAASPAKVGWDEFDESDESDDFDPTSEFEYFMDVGVAQDVRDWVMDQGGKMTDAIAALIYFYENSALPGEDSVIAQLPGISGGEASAA